MARIYLRYAIKNKIYRASADDLGLTNTRKPHDVIVVSVNKRSKKCKVKTITSLEYNINQYNGGPERFVFINNKLDDVRNGKITVIPKKDINTNHLSGVNNKIITIKTNRMYLSTTGTKFPRRYKHLINK